MATLTETWEPANHLEQQLRDALRAGDQDAYFAALSVAELLVPAPQAEPGAPQPAFTWPTATRDGRTHVLAYTSPEAARLCLGPGYEQFARMPLTDIARAWPNIEWWLAVDSGLPIEGYLPAWFIGKLTSDGAQQADASQGGEGAAPRAASPQADPRHAASPAAPPHAPDGRPFGDAPHAPDGRPFGDAPRDQEGRPFADVSRGQDGQLLRNASHPDDGQPFRDGAPPAHEHGPAPAGVPASHGGPRHGGAPSGFPPPGDGMSSFPGQATPFPPQGEPPAPQGDGTSFRPPEAAPFPAHDHNASIPPGEPSGFPPHRDAPRDDAASLPGQATPFPPQGEPPAPHADGTSFRPPESAPFRAHDQNPSLPPGDPRGFPPQGEAPSFSNDTGPFRQGENPPFPQGANPPVPPGEPRPFPPHAEGRHSRGETGPYAVPGESGPYPGQGESGPYPTQGEPGPYSPQGEPGRFPAQGEPRAFPPQGDAGSYPPQGEPGPLPSQPDAVSYPAQGDSGPYPVHGEARPPYGEQTGGAHREASAFPPPGDAGPFSSRDQAQSFPSQDGSPPHGDAPSVPPGGIPPLPLGEASGPYGNGTAAPEERPVRRRGRRHRAPRHDADPASAGEAPPFPPQSETPGPHGDPSRAPRHGDPSRAPRHGDASPVPAYGDPSSLPPGGVPPVPPQGEAGQGERPVHGESRAPFGEGPGPYGEVPPAMPERMPHDPAAPHRPALLNGAVPPAPVDGVPAVAETRPQPAVSEFGAVPPAAPHRDAAPPAPEHGGPGPVPAAYGDPGPADHHGPDAASGEHHALGPAPADQGGPGPVPAEHHALGPAPAEHIGTDPAPSGQHDFGPAPADQGGPGPVPAEHHALGPAPAEHIGTDPAPSGRHDFGPAPAGQGGPGAASWPYDASPAGRATPRDATRPSAPSAPAPGGPSGAAQGGPSALVAGTPHGEPPAPETEAPYAARPAPGEDAPGESASGQGTPGHGTPVVEPSAPWVAGPESDLPITLNFEPGTEFAPLDDEERALYDAAQQGDGARFLRILSGARQIWVPMVEGTDLKLGPGRPGFHWYTREEDGRTVVPLFTGPSRMREAMGGHPFVLSDPAKVLRFWPDPSWDLVVNAGSPIGGTIPGERMAELSRFVDAENAALLARDFPAQNDSESRLFDARTDVDLMVKVLLEASVFLPVWSRTPPTAQTAPGDPEFPWSAVPVRGRMAVTVFTSFDWMKEAVGTTAFVMPAFAEMLAAWPQADWSVSVNPGTPIEVTLSGEQIRALGGAIADRVPGTVTPPGGGVIAPPAEPMPVDPMPAEGTAGPDVGQDGAPDASGAVPGAPAEAPAGAPAESPAGGEEAETVQPVQPAEAPEAAETAQAASGPAPGAGEAADAAARIWTIMQKVVPHEQVPWYRDKAYDRVAGFVHRVRDVIELTTPKQLYEALGLIRHGSPFHSDDAEVHVIRWPAYLPDLYRVPFGGNGEGGLATWGDDGWVIEDPPFQGDGFAPGSGGSIPEYKVDSLRLPHGAEMYVIGNDGTERFIARYDADRLVWGETK